MIYKMGSKVRLTLHDDTIIEGVLVRDHSYSDLIPSTDGKEGPWVFDFLRVKASRVKKMTLLKKPQPADIFSNGAILYAENNGYHHVWVKSGGAWYTANRMGRMSWEAILEKCDGWKMKLWQVPTPDATDSIEWRPEVAYTP
jgi:hypothetical protein